MTRSAVRSRLAPPAFAGFACFGSAGHAISNKAKPARAVAPELEERRRTGMRFVYILESLDGVHFYAGMTDDVPARLAKHNAGEVLHTSKFRPWRIKTYIAFADEKKAIAFEKYLKSGSGRAFVKKRL